MPIAEHRLKRRGQSLADAGLKLRIERPTGQPDRMLVTRDFRDDKRTVGVRLTFVSGGHCVLAREVSLIRGDKPLNASEAQMRSGPRQRDGTPPDATLSYDATPPGTPPPNPTRPQITPRAHDEHAQHAQTPR